MRAKLPSAAMLYSGGETAVKLAAWALMVAIRDPQPVALQSAPSGRHESRNQIMTLRLLGRGFTGGGGGSGGVGGGGGGGGGGLHEKSYASSRFGPPHSGSCRSPRHGVPMHSVLGRLSAVAVAVPRSLGNPQKHRAPSSTPATLSPALPHATAQFSSDIVAGASLAWYAGSTGPETRKPR